jgi:hypothetical protein
MANNYEETISKVSSNLDKYKEEYDTNEPPKKSVISSVRERIEEKNKSKEEKEVIIEKEINEPLTPKEKTISIIKRYILFYILILMLLLSIQPDFILDDNVVRKDNLVYYKHKINWSKVFLYTTIFYIPYFIWIISDTTKIAEKVKSWWK